MRICVIMSTYNGINYIEEQFDSILAQNINDDIIFFIRDDGSTDETLSFIEQYKENKQVNIIVERGRNVGPSKSFWLAIQSAPYADYYAFCDQDDIWKQGKLKKALTDIEKEKKGSPILWLSNFSVVDQNGTILKKRGIVSPELSPLKVMFYNNVPGCVMIFNNLLIEEMRKIKIEEIRMHDIIALNIAIISGKVIFCDEAYIKYRQHDYNVLGYGHKKFMTKKWLQCKLRLLKDKERYDISEYALQVLKNYSDRLSAQDKKEYYLIAHYKELLFGNLKLLSKWYTKDKFGRTSLSIRSKVFLKLF